MARTETDEYLLDLEASNERLQEALGRIRVELCAHQEPSAAIQNAYGIAVQAGVDGGGD